MRELFRLKIASKRQMTVPQRLLNILQLAEGDEIRLEVDDAQIVKVEACKVVPTRLFTPEVLSQLAIREAETTEGRNSQIDPKKLMREATGERVTTEEDETFRRVIDLLESSGMHAEAAELIAARSHRESQAYAEAGAEPAQKVGRGAA